MKHPKEEQSFVMIKPDGVRKGLIGEIIRRLEQRDLKIVALEMFQPEYGQLDNHYPKNEEWINSLTTRFVDLLAPFQKFYYYDFKQEGSASLKKVLPALTGRAYEGLEIAHGDSASLQYLYITHGAADGTKPNGNEIAKIRQNLERYCSLDTEGMVEILRVLNKI